MNKTIILLAFAAVLVSCKKSGIESAKYASMKKAEWILGNWENKSQEGILTETWTKENDSVFKGQSYFIKEKDTLHDESVTLSQNGEELIYSPTVKGQNSDKPVAFKMTSITETKMVFENRAHDYPQRIAYNKIGNDSLLARISGIQQGKPSSEDYPMKKTN